jgi:apolipoprotein N-acyltransferase
VLLGYSQVTTLPIAQLASVIGVYGISALVGAVSAAAALWGVRVSLRVRVAAASVIVFALALVTWWGSSRIAGGRWARTGDLLRVGVVQGNVDQAEKWNAARAASIFGDHLRMTREAVNRGAKLVVWPESSTPFYFEEDPASGELVRRLARESRVAILLGSDEVERGSPTRYYNSAFLVQIDGRTSGVYRKMHLVPFGEYVPLKRLLFFAAPLVQAVSDFSPGARPALLPLGDHLISAAICYEIVYPGLVRQFVVGGSELLTTITNDAWFGRTSAPYQHFAQASMRAIEQGRYLVRSANTGISGIVDPYGRVLAQTGIFQPAVVVGDVRLVTGSTIYARVGDAFAYAAVLVTGLALLATRSRSRV